MYYVYLDGTCKTTIIGRSDTKEGAEKIKAEIEGQTANATIRIVKKENKKI